jgi:hypothetical protein
MPSPHDRRIALALGLRVGCDCCVTVPPTIGPREHSPFTLQCLGRIFVGTPWFDRPSSPWSLSCRPSVSWDSAGPAIARSRELCR